MVDNIRSACFMGSNERQVLSEMRDETCVVSASKYGEEFKQLAMLKVG